VIRGELWSVAGAVYASKPRPALILQDDRFGATESVTVCPLASTVLSAPLLRVPILADALNGLDADSYLMVDKLTTVRRSHVTTRIGLLSSAQLVEIERLVMVFLGLAD
jgi:mRNA interferase MazF